MTADRVVSGDSGVRPLKTRCGGSGLFYEMAKPVRARSHHATLETKVPEGRPEFTSIPFGYLFAPGAYLPRSASLRPPTAF